VSVVDINLKWKHLGQQFNILSGTVLLRICCIFSTFVLRTREIHFILFPSEEPEEEVSLEDLEEKAKSGDARAQCKVSVHQHIAKIIDCNGHTVASQVMMNVILRATC